MREMREGMVSIMRRWEEGSRERLIRTLRPCSFAPGFLFGFVVFLFCFLFCFWVFFGRELE